VTGPPQPAAAAPDPALTVIFAYRRTNTYGPHVVAGALEVLPPPTPVEVRFIEPGPALAGAVDAAARVGPVLVAWSFYSPDFARACADLAAVRDLVDAPHITHLAGGVHASAEPRQTLDAGWDLVAIGEGETTFAEVVAALATGSDPLTVGGLGFRDPDGHYHATGPAQRHDLDRFPPFAHRLGRYNAIEITRGCVYACSFCQTPFLFKARFRHRSVDNVVEHVRRMRSTGRRDVRGTEVNLDAVAELLGRTRDAAGEGGRVYFGSFPSEVRPEHCTPAALAVLRRHVSNDNLVIGAQSGDDSVLAATNRGHDAAAVEAAVRACLAAGFRANVDFLFGLPGEDDGAAQRSLQLAERLADLGARIHTHTFRCPAPRCERPNRAGSARTSPARWSGWRAGAGPTGSTAARRALPNNRSPSRPAGRPPGNIAHSIAEAGNYPACAIAWPSA
jgi:B12-binding domain/radical SAM domain protein